ncbi:WD40 repeat domain-containing protein [Jidongwangia harbinensis]|uniref:WD40 repeat domain-containing protein n=1 Tax=Jidongwangia harbinensis TaxID=2878561 RepID=UPI001CD93114|nr:WD40 repeat domain-containing protein [Jidongwangia harbinensis]MCA2212531.1 WD40 repeat domain-containing protein [Jidongwangia harbinensis]
MAESKQILVAPGSSENVTDTEHIGITFALAGGRWAGRPVFASGGKDRLVRLWDAATGQPLGPALTGHADAVRYAAFAGPEHDILVTADDRNVVLRWDLRDGTPHAEPLLRSEHTIAGVGEAVVDGHALVGVGTEDGLVRIFDAGTGALHADLHIGAGLKMTRSDVGVLDGQLVALTVAHDPAVDCGAYLATVTLWDVASGAPRQEPGKVPNESEYFGILATANDRLVAVLGFDPAEQYGDDPYQSEYFLDHIGDFRVVDVAGDEELFLLEHEGGPLEATVARSPRGDVVLVAMESMHIAVVAVGGVDRPGDVEESRYTWHSTDLCSVAAAEVGGRTVVASADVGGIRFWDLHDPGPGLHRG